MSKSGHIVLTIIRAEQEFKICTIIKKTFVCFYVSSTDQINVYIDVLGPSLNPPSFQQDFYSYNVSEAAELNTTVAVVTADDPDPGM